MRQLTYLAVLAGCLLGTLPLELLLRVRVYARWRRLLAAAAEFFDLHGTARLRTPVELSAELAGDVIAMGPNAFHQPTPPNGPVADHLDATLRIFRPITPTAGGE